MPEHDMKMGREGIGTPPGGVPNTDKALRDLRIEMDSLLRRHGFPDGLNGLDRIPGQGGAGTGVGDVVRAEDHQRLSAPSRETMRRSALAAASSGPGYTEQMIAAFVAFCMKGSLPGPGNTWLLPYSSWAEASQAFWSLYSDERVWTEWWAMVQ